MTQISTGKFYGALAVTVLVIVLAFMALAPRSAPAVSGFGDSANFWTKTATSTKETVSASASTQILATSTSRKWTNISNNSGFPIFCNFGGGAPAAAGAGLLINASSTYEISGGNLYQGSIDCIAQGSAATVYVQANQQ